MPVTPAIAAAKTLIQKQTALVAGTGTIATTGTAVTGTTTDFDPELTAGLTVIIADGQARLVTARASDTAATINEAFANDLPALTTFEIVTFTNLEGAADLSGPSQQGAQIDVSSFSTQGFRDKITGLRDPGSLDFTVWYQPKKAIHAELQSDFDSGLTLVWKVWIPDAADGTAPPSLKNSFLLVAGSMNQISFEASTDGAWQASGSVLLTGKPYVIVGVD